MASNTQISNYESPKRDRNIAESDNDGVDKNKHEWLYLLRKTFQFNQLAACNRQMEHIKAVLK